MAVWLEQKRADLWELLRAVWRDDQMAGYWVWQMVGYLVSRLVAKMEQKKADRMDEKKVG